MDFERDVYEYKRQVTNGATWSINKLWESAIQQYGMPLMHYCISILYTIYTYCTPLNVALFFVKSVPTGVYVTRLIKNIYISSRERMKQKQIEVQDLQLQINILSTKLSMRDAEYGERAEDLRRGVEWIRRLRSRIHQVVAEDEDLRQELRDCAWVPDSDTHVSSPPEEREYIVRLLKDLKEDADMEVNSAPSSARAGGADPTIGLDESVYSSASDADSSQDCRVKIVKVTNVYKVAYLKHFVKQRKLRRSMKHTLLKKKVEAVKKLLDDWQHTLNMVTNNKMSMLTMNSRYEMASQEAMGDFTKQDIREFSETDSDFGNFHDNFYEQPALSFTQNSNRNSTSWSLKEVSDTVWKDASVPQSGKGQYSLQAECSPRATLSDLPEETSSELAIAEHHSDVSDEYEQRDNVLI